MPVTITRTGQIKLNLEGAAKAVADAAIKHMRERIAEGVDARGSQFAEYSPLVQEQFAAIGEPTTPAVRLSKLVEGLRVVSIQIDTNGLVKVTFGVTGASASRPRPPPWVLSSTKTPEQRARALEGWRAAAHRPAEPLSDAAKVAITASTGPNRAARILIGISPEGMEEIRQVLQRFPIFQ